MLRIERDKDGGPAGAYESSKGYQTSKLCTFNRL